MQLNTMPDRMQLATIGGQCRGGRGLSPSHFGFVLYVRDGYKPNMEIEPTLEAPRPRPWGFWMTTLFTVIIALVAMFVQIITAIGFFIVSKLRDPDLSMPDFFESIDMNGCFMSFAGLVELPFIIGLVWLFIKIRKISPANYLQLHPAAKRDWWRWGALLLVFLVAADVINILADRPIIPEFMFAVYKTACFRPLLFLVVIVVAPIVEELLFRGFIFTGLQHSPLRAPGAIVITSLIWSMLHIQYDLFDMTFLFFLGIILGLMRVRTGSFYLPLVAHVAVNLIASIQLLVALKFFGAPV